MYLTNIKQEFLQPHHQVTHYKVCFSNLRNF